MKLTPIAAALLLCSMLTACGSRQPSPEDSSPSGDQLPAGDTSNDEMPPRETVFFARDSYDLSDEARLSLDDQAAWMLENPEREVVIHGFASEPGTATYNLTLANNRANAMREYLVSKGVDIARISVVSHGESQADVPPSAKRRAVFATERDDAE